MKPVDGTSEAVKQGAGASGGNMPGSPSTAHVPELFDRQLDSQSMHKFESGTRRLADTFERINEENGRAWASNAVSEARLKWTQNFVERQANAGPAAPNFTGQLIDDYDKYASETVEKAPTRNSKLYLQNQLNDFRATLGGQAAHFEANARIDWRNDMMTNSIQNSKKLMNTDPSQYQAVLSERLAEIDAADLPPIKKSALRQTAIDSISTAAVWSQIQRNPTNFLQSIGFYGDEDTGPGTGGQPKLRKSMGDFQGRTGNTAFDMMPYQQRVTMFEAAIKAKNQLDVDADRAVGNQRKDLANKFMIEGWDRFYSGKLTLDYVNSGKSLISDNDYKSLREAMRKGPELRTRSDSASLESIYRQIDNGDYEGARKATYQAHHAGLLKDDGADGLTGILNHVNTLIRQQGPKSPYERSHAFITTSMDPGPMVRDPVGRARLAESISAFENWYNLGKSPDGKPWTEQQIEQRGKEIVKQYKFIDFGETVLALPMPRGSTIHRQTGNPDQMEKEIVAAGINLQKEFSNKKLLRPEYELEMDTLNRWREVMLGMRQTLQQTETKQKK